MFNAFVIKECIKNVFLSVLEPGISGRSLDLFLCQPMSCCWPFALAASLVRYLWCVVTEDQFCLISLPVAYDLNGDKQSIFLQIPSAAYSLLDYEQHIRPWQNGTSGSVPTACYSSFSSGYLKMGVLLHPILTSETNSGSTHLNYPYICLLAQLVISRHCQEQKEPR